MKEIRNNNNNNNNNKGLVKFPDLLGRTRKKKFKKVFKSRVLTKKLNNGIQLEYILYINDKPGGVGKEYCTEYENLVFRTTQKVESFEGEN